MFNLKNLSRTDLWIISLIVICILLLFLSRNEFFTSHSDHPKLKSLEFKDGIDWRELWNQEDHDRTNKDKGGNYYCTTSYDPTKRIVMTPDDARIRYTTKGFTLCEGDMPVLITAPHGGSLFLSSNNGNETTEVENYRNTQTLLNYTFKRWDEDRTNNKWKHFVTEEDVNVSIKKSGSKTRIVDTGVELEPDQPYMVRITYDGDDKVTTISNKNYSSLIHDYIPDYFGNRVRFIPGSLKTSPNFEEEVVPVGIFKKRDENTWGQVIIPWNDDTNQLKPGDWCCVDAGTRLFHKIMKVVKLKGKSDVRKVYVDNLPDNENHSLGTFLYVRRYPSICKVEKGVIKKKYKTVFYTDYFTENDKVKLNLITKSKYSKLKQLRKDHKARGEKKLSQLEVEEFANVTDSDSDSDSDPELDYEDEEDNNDDQAESPDLNLDNVEIDEETKQEAMIEEKILKLQKFLEEIK